MVWIVCSVAQAARAQKSDEGTLYFTRPDGAVMEILDHGKEGIDVRRAWPPDGSPRAKWMPREYYAERVGGDILVLPDHATVDFDSLTSAVFRVAILLRPNHRGGYDIIGLTTHLGSR